MTAAIVTIEGRTIGSEAQHEFFPLRWVQIQVDKTFSRDLLRLRWMLFKHGLTEVRVPSAPMVCCPTLLHVVKQLGPWELVVSRNASGVYFRYEAAVLIGTSRIVVARSVPQPLDAFLDSVKQGRHTFGNVPGIKEPVGAIA